ncbi:hypothetical protein DQ04_11501000 [Trypanosoma grayi]|uniref:hypothetical protein n=1 Tax=Trypanosoma grayi TaxID=71804 RepID=UPI0004F4B731|nr:hypothetical protein DQ04_11501000 [Trypanosoma grayi]KEG06954.1 hypothetical protein DQ04_11501000 [Trypanosoma grayi]
MSSKNHGSNHKTPPPPPEGVLSVVRTAVKSGHTDLLQRQCNQLIGRITVLATIILETTSNTLDRGATPRVRHVDPTVTALQKPGVHTNNNIKSGNKGVSASGGSVAGSKTPNPSLGTPKLASVARNLFTTDTHSASTPRAGVGDSRNGALRCKSGNALWSPGVGESSQYFIEKRELTDEEVAAALAVVARGEQHPYHELMHIESFEVKESGKASPRCDETQRLLSYCCFTRAIYAHYPSVAATATPRKESGKGGLNKPLRRPGSASRTKSGSLKTTPSKTPRGGTTKCNDATPHVAEADEMSGRAGVVVWEPALPPGQLTHSAPSATNSKRAVVPPARGDGDDAPDADLSTPVNGDIRFILRSSDRLYKVFFSSTTTLCSGTNEGHNHIQGAKPPIQLRPIPTTSFN